MKHLIRMAALLLVAAGAVGEGAFAQGPGYPPPGFYPPPWPPAFYPFPGPPIVYPTPGPSIGNPGQSGGGSSQPLARAVEKARGRAKIDRGAQQQPLSQPAARKFYRPDLGVFEVLQLVPGRGWVRVGFAQR
jgi:hypothetical protein